MTEKSIHQYAALQSDGEEIKMDKYQGKVLLIVNTASKCGFTPQYQGLQELYEKYHDRGLEVLAFPSNDFGDQEPLDGKAIEEFCSLEFRTTFPVFEKIKVVGEDAHPIYKFLSFRDENGKFNGKPRWNFHKYLVNKSGHVVDYFYTFIKPTSKKIVNQIEMLLADES